MRVHLLAPLSLLLAGCVSLLPEPPPPGAIYGLSAGEVAKANVAPKDIVVTIAQPAAPRSVMGPDIVWRTGSSIAFMEGASWDGAAPDQLRFMLADILSRRGELKAASPSGGMRADAEVRWSIHDFAVVEDGGQVNARFVATFYLVALRGREVQDVLRVEKSAPIARRSGREAVRGLEQVAREGLTEAAIWIAANAEPRKPIDQPSAASTTR